MQLDAYFQGLVETPMGVRSILDVIKFNNANPQLEKPKGFEDQSMLVSASMFCYTFSNCFMIQI